MFILPMHRRCRPATAPKTRSVAAATLARLIYLSRSRMACDPLQPLASLQGVLDGWLRRTASRGITGIQLFDGNRFSHVMEGRCADVEAVFAEIRNETWHDEIVVIERGNIGQRSFAAWSMRYVDSVAGVELPLGATPPVPARMASAPQAVPMLVLLRYCLQAAG